MELVKNFRENAALRASFNALAEQTFDGLNFETWYTNGHWTDNYCPYAVVEDGEVIANVSVNRTPILVDGTVVRLFQIGTVMTKPEYRNKGLSRLLMAEIEKDLAAEADGFYLFAHTGVLQFYPKFGYRPAGGAYSGQTLNGLLLSVENPEAFYPVTAGAIILAALLLRHGDKMAENARVDWLDKLVGSYALSDAIANKNLSALFQSWIDAQDAYLPTKVDLYA